MTARGVAPRPRRTWGNRLTALLAALGLVAVVITTQGTGTTEASWNEAEHAQATFTAGRLGAPSARACTIADKTITPSWLVPAPPSVQPANYQHRMYWKPLLGAEELVRDWTTTGTATQFAYTVPSTILQAGSYRFQVRAVAGSWTTDPISGTATVVALLGVVSISGCSWS